ncbi:MAG: mandelate racemase/muconate lactonizing enzyme family protein [Oscillospiraceae bacterium]|nr:mandelate racemase/muconate lactonizing enzyme family protein [Oscillospiraceae bacterium]
MKITKVDILHLKTDLNGGAWRPIVCRIYTDEGIYGDGEAALAYGQSQFAAAGQLKNFAKLIIGMNPLHHETIWDKLYRTSFWGQNGGPVVFAGISAIDIALWDIRGKYYNAPVHELLGGKRRDGLRTYASQLQCSWGYENVAQLSPQDYAREAKRAVDEGYDAIKIDFFTYRPDGTRFTDLDRIGLRSAYYIDLIEERVAAVREAIGPKVDLIMENHSFTDANCAIQLARAVEKYGIFYFEEPSTPTPQLAKFVHDSINIPVANGERIYTRWQYADYFRDNSIQVIQPDIGTCGGITEVKKVCDMAYTYDVGVQVHACGSPLSTAAALMVEAVIPNFVIHEHHMFARTRYNRELCLYDYQPVNGKFQVPDLPGIGNELSPVAFQHCDKVTIE